MLDVAGCAALGAQNAAGTDLEHDGVVVNPLLQSSDVAVEGKLIADDIALQQQQQQPPAINRDSAVGVVASDDDSFWQQLAAGDEGFLAGSWQDSEDAYKEALPLAAGHLVSVSEHIACFSSGAVRGWETHTAPLSPSLT